MIVSRWTPVIRSMERMLEPSANAPITAIFLSVLSTKGFRYGSGRCPDHQGSRKRANRESRYSPSGVTSSQKLIYTGNPNEDLISTSYVERLNATTRLHMRRLTRLTLAFSKKRENFVAAVGLHFAYYNFVKRHNTLRCTPAMAAGVTGTTWSVGDLVEATA
jgi:hypothetical protein